jgi:hypothetical protein
LVRWRVNFESNEPRCTPAATVLKASTGGLGFRNFSRRPVRWTTTSFTKVTGGCPSEAALIAVLTKERRD